MTPVPGDRFLTHRVKNWNSYNPGNIGKNQVWDYSTFTIDFDWDMVYEVIHSAPTPYASAFDTPAICIKWTYAFDQVVLNYSFFKNTTNSLINLGYINSLGKAKYTDPDTTFSFPITFNQVISDSFAYYREADTLYQSFAGKNQYSGV